MASTSKCLVLRLSYYRKIAVRKILLVLGLGLLVGGLSSCSNSTQTRETAQVNPPNRSQPPASNPAPQAPQTNMLNGSRPSATSNPSTTPKTAEPPTVPSSSESVAKKPVVDTPPPQREPTPEPTGGNEVAKPNSTEPVSPDKSDDASKSSESRVQPTNKSGTELGDTMPEIEGKDLDGDRFALSDYQGKVLMVDFWGDW